MSKTAFLVPVRHAGVGEGFGAIDAAGRWIAFIPGKKSDEEVAAIAYKSGYTPAPADAKITTRAQAQLDRWFATGETPEVAPAGTPFQKSVWAELLKIPRGETTCYGAIAGRIGCKSARAVGQAVGANPVGLFIPCHRVLEKSGRIGGFAWGVDMKTRLLRVEIPGAGAGRIKSA